jgi:hypothetical protein
MSIWNYKTRVHHGGTEDTDKRRKGIWRVVPVWSFPNRNNPPSLIPPGKEAFLGNAIPIQIMPRFDEAELLGLFESVGLLTRTNPKAFFSVPSVTLW